MRCSLVIKGVDDDLLTEIKKQLGLFKKDKTYFGIASLRDLYNEKTKQSLPIEEAYFAWLASGNKEEDFSSSQKYYELLKESAKLLADFRRSEINESRRKERNYSTHAVTSETIFRRIFPSYRQADVLDSVVYMFRDFYDRLQHMGLSDNVILNGRYKNDGTKEYGANAIFDAIYDKVFNERGKLIYFRQLLGQSDNFVETKDSRDQSKEKDYESAEKTVGELCTITKDNVYSAINNYGIKRNMTDREKLDMVIDIYTDMLNNWASVVVHAKREIAVNDGIIIGVGEDYGYVTEDTEGGENDLEISYDQEEAGRDSYDAIREAVSSFDKARPIVKSFLSKLEQKIDDEDGVYTVRTIMGFPKHMKAKRTFTTLKYELRYASSEEEMIHMLGKFIERGHPSYEPLLDKLIYNDEFRNSFFLAMNGGFQLYGRSSKTRGKFGRTYWKTFVSNKKSTVSALGSMLSGVPISPMSIFSKNVFNAENAEKIKNEIIFLFGTPLYNKDKRLKSFLDNTEVTDDDRRRNFELLKEHVYGELNDTKNPLINAWYTPIIDGFGKERESILVSSLTDILRSLGYDVSIEDTREIVRNQKCFNDLKDNLFDFIQFYLPHVILQHNQSKQRDGLSLQSAMDINGGGESTDTLLDLYKRIDDIVGSTTNGGRYENKARAFDKKSNKIWLYSDVNGSFLLDFFNRVHSFSSNFFFDESSAKKLTELREYINEKYLCSSQFFIKSEGRILNRWLKDMYSSSSFGMYESIESTHISANMEVIEDTGMKDKRSQDYGSLDHALSMISHFFEFMSIKKKPLVYQDTTAQSDTAIYTEAFNYFFEKSSDDEKPVARESVKNHILIFNNTEYAYELDRNKTSIKRIARPTAWYSTFILGDSGKSKYLCHRVYSMKEIFGISKDDYMEGETIAESDFINSEYWNIFLSEKHRMRQAHDAYNHKVPDPNNPGKFIKEPLGDKTYLSKRSTFSNLMYLNDLVSELMTSKGIQDTPENRMEVIDSLTISDITNATLEYLRYSFEIFKKNMSDLGVLNKTNDSFNYLYNEARLYGVLNNTLSVDESNNEMFEPSNDDIENVLFDFFINHKFSQIMQSQLFAIDQSFYKDVKAYQKRNKQETANGRSRNKDAEVAGESKERTSVRRVMYFKDMVFDSFYEDPNFFQALIYQFAEDKEKAKEMCKKHSELIALHSTDIESANAMEKDFMSQLKALVGEGYFKHLNSYRKSSVTDGQAFVSLEGMRRTLVQTGAWTKETSEAYDILKAMNEKVMRGEELSPSEIQKITQCAVRMQPEKPFTYTTEKRTDFSSGDTALLAVQIKCAEVLCTPCLCKKGSSMYNMAVYMIDRTGDEEHDIDVMASSEAVKVGCWGMADLSGLQTYDEFKSTLNNAYVHTLDAKDCRIQNNVPAHMNQSRLFGTQLRKLVLGRIRMDGKYGHYFDKLVSKKESIDLGDGTKTSLKDFNGRDLVRLYNNLNMACILDSLQLFEDIVNDNKKLSVMLKQNVINAAKQNIDALFAYSLTGDEDFALPLFEAGIEHDTMATMLSVFRNNVVKQKMSGGSFVQCAPLDEDLRCIMHETDGVFDNILEVECVIPFAEQYTDASGKIIDIKWEDYLDANGYPLDNGKGGTKIEDDFPEILNIVAYRIPTERAYSVMNLRVKRFTKGVGGGIIQVPPQFTTVAGFDFDVDKLFILRKTFIEEQLSKSKKNDIVKKILNTVIPGKSVSTFNSSDKYEERDMTVEDALRDAGVTHFGTQTAVDSLINAIFGVEVDDNKNGKYTYDKAWIDAGLDKVEFELDNKKIVFPSFTSFFSYIKGVGKMMEYDYTKNCYEQVERSDEDSPSVTKKKDEIQRSLRGNALLDITRARLSDEETFSSRFTPGNFDTMRGAAYRLMALSLNPKSVCDDNGKIDSDKLSAAAYVSNEPEYDYTDPMTIIRFNQQNQVADKLIGMAANHNANHNFAVLLSKFRLNSETEIFMFGNHYSDLIHGDDNMGSFVDAWVAEFLAASVDAVKDPVLNFLNLNTNTMNVAELMVRLGMEPYQMGLFLKQPIIVQICEDIVNNDISMQTAISKAENRLKKIGVTMSEKDVNQMLKNGSIFNEDNLAQNIVDGFNSKIDAKEQLVVLKQFERLNAIASELNTFIVSTRNTASGSIRSTAGDILSNIDRARKSVEYEYLEFDVSDYSDMEIPQGRGLIDPNITENDFETITKDKLSYLKNNAQNPFAYEQCMMDASHRMMHLLCKKFPYMTPRYKAMRSILMSITRFVPNGQLYNKLHNAYLAYYFAGMKGSVFDGNKQIKIKVNGDEISVSQRQYYRYFFGSDLRNFVKKYENDDTLSNVLKYATLDMESYSYSYNGMEKTVKLPRLRLSDIALSVDERDTFVQYLDEMLHNSNAEYNVMAIKLFLFGFYNSAFEYSDLSFLSLIPTSIKRSLIITDDEGKRTGTYTDKLLELLNQGSQFDKNDLNNFIVSFALNHLNERTIAPTVNSYDLGDDKKTPFGRSEDGKKLYPHVGSKQLDRYIWFDSKTKKYHCPPVIQVDEGDKEVNVYVLTPKKLDLKSDSNSAFVFSKEELGTLAYNLVGNVNDIRISGKNYDALDFEKIQSGYQIFDINDDSVRLVSKSIYLSNEEVEALDSDELDGFNIDGEESSFNNQPIDFEIQDAMTDNVVDNIVRVLGLNIDNLDLDSEQEEIFGGQKSYGVFGSKENMFKILDKLNEVIAENPDGRKACR